MRDLWCWLREPVPIAFPRGLWAFITFLIVDQWLRAVSQHNTRGFVAMLAVAVPVSVMVGVWTYRFLGRWTDESG